MDILHDIPTSLLRGHIAERDVDSVLERADMAARRAVADGGDSLRLSIETEARARAAFSFPQDTAMVLNAMRHDKLATYLDEQAFDFIEAMMDHGAVAMGDFDSVARAFVISLVEHKADELKLTSLPDTVGDDLEIVKK